MSDSRSITIADKQFTFQPRYSEGHVLTANEASALNQTFAENLRNNFATKLKGEGGDALTQADFDTYAEAYQFGVRTGGGGGSRGNPVETEAMNIARDIVRQKIVAAGKKLGDYSAKQVSGAAEKLLADKPEVAAEIREQAKARVEQMQKAASAAVDDDIIAGLGEGDNKSEEAIPPSPETPTEPRSRKRGATAE